MERFKSNAVAPKPPDQSDGPVSREEVSSPDKNREWTQTKVNGGFKPAEKREAKRTGSGGLDDVSLQKPGQTPVVPFDSMVILTNKINKEKTELAGNIKRSGTHPFLENETNQVTLKVSGTDPFLVSVEKKKKVEPADSFGGTRRSSQSSKIDKADTLITGSGTQLHQVDKQQQQPPVSGLPQKVQESQIPSALPQTPGSENSISRKSAWERAEERFQQQERAMMEKQRHPTAKMPLVPTYTDADDEYNSLVAQDSICCNQRSIRTVFRSKKFKNPKLEQLYQRYFFKLNQNNLTLLMALLSALCVLLVIFHYVGGSTTVAKGIVLGIAFLGFISLEIIANHSSFNHLQLFIVTYIVFALVVVMVIVVSVDTTPQTASSDGIWVTVFCVLMTYTLLPVRMRLSVLAGLVLAVAHIVCAAVVNDSEPFLWKQVRFPFLFVEILS